MKSILTFVFALSAIVTSAQHNDTCHIDFPIGVNNPFSEGTSDRFGIRALSNLDSIRIFLVDSNHHEIGDTSLSRIEENTYLDLQRLITPFREKKDVTFNITCAAIYWIDGLQYACAAQTILTFR